MDSMVFGAGHYVVSVDIMKLQKNPRFYPLTRPGDNGLFRNARFVGRADDGNAYYLTDAAELGGLVGVLLTGVENDAGVTVTNIDNNGLPSHLENNALDYFRAYYENS
jgi:hypothetical protein